MLRKAIGSAAFLVLIIIVGTAATARAQQPVTAAPDDVHTPVNTPVDIDPAANDTIESPYTLDHVEIESDPIHGVATVNPDGKKFHYVPDAGYVGPDSMQYNIIVCSDLSIAGVQANQVQKDCREDGSDISITVDPAPETTTTSTVPETTTTPTVPVTDPGGTVAQAAESSTSSPGSTAVAAANGELPRTGGGSAPIGAGVAAVVIGLAAVGFARTRRRG